MSKINIIFDASMLDAFLACPAKFNYRHNLNKVTPIKAAPLDMGGVIHVGMETYYKALKEGERFENAVDLAIKRSRYELGTNSDLPTADGEHAISTIEQNLIYWRVADQGFKIEVVESPFTYVLYEDDTFRIVMMGKIDLLITDNRYENLPVDHKSFKRDFPVHRKTNQFLNYTNACKSHYLLVNRIGLQKSLKAHEKFKRVMLSYDDAFHEQWRQNVIKWCMRYYDCVESNEWPMNDTSCDKYNRLCEYYEICDTSGNDNKIYKLETNFKTDQPWDVGRILSNKGE